MSVTWDASPDNNRKLRVMVNGTLNSPGTVILSLPAGVVSNLTGSPNTASTSIDNVVTLIAGSSATPTVTIDASPDINSSNVTNYPVSGTCSENGQAVIVSVGGISPSPQPTCVGGVWSAVVNVSSIPDGASIVITADHSDSAGNPATQSTDTIDKDTSLPTVAITSAPDINSTNITNYPVSGTCSENGQTVVVSVGGIAPSPQPTCVGGVWSAVVNVSSIPDGTSIVVTADHSDSAGNPATQATDTVDKDTSLPTVAITSAPDINSSNVTNYPVSGTCSENGQAVIVSVGGISPSPQPTCVGGVWSAVVNVSSLPDGTNIVITADHSDSAGNPATQATDTVDKDTSLPTVTINNAPDINSTNVTNYPVSGTCSENGQAVVVSVGGISPSPQPICVGGVWNATVNVSSLPDGTNIVITADHSDSAGNPATQATDTVDKDTSLPTVTINNAPDINSTNVTNYPVSGTCSENGQAVVVSVGGISPSPQPICVGGVWNATVNVSSLPDGTNIVVTADHSDSAGNPATQATDTVDKDTSLPTVTINNAPDINDSNVTNYPVSGTCSENGQAVVVSVGGISPSPQPTCSGGVWSTTVNVSAVTNGTNIVVTADHSDTAGNPATQATDSVDKMVTCNPNAGPTYRVSVDGSGVQGSRDSFVSAISGDGQYIAFISHDPNLVAGGTSGSWDIFVRDRNSGVTERVSVDGFGIQGNDLSSSPSISANGRYVAFLSKATNLVVGDINGWKDLFVHDRNTGLTELVSVDSFGVQANHDAWSPSISADGRYVVFRSSATNLVVGDSNLAPDIFVHDRNTGITERVSIDSFGVQSNSLSSLPAISADGRYVSFSSWATNLVPGDTNGRSDVFVHDRNTGVTELVSVDSFGVQGNRYSYESSMSDGGRYVAFRSSASNLVAGDTNGAYDFFVHDRNTGITERVSIDSFGVQSNATPSSASVYSTSYAPSISGDGRYVTFRSEATNLVVGDTNGWQDIFVHDRNTNITKRVSVDSSGLQANNISSNPMISADGKFVTFSSEATNLVCNDTNNKDDVFVRDIQ